MNNNFSNIKLPRFITKDNQEFWLQFFKLKLDCEKSQFPNNPQFMNTLQHLNNIQIPHQLKYNSDPYSTDQITSQLRGVQNQLFRNVDLNVYSFIDELNQDEAKGLIGLYEELDALGEADLIDANEYMDRINNYFIENRFKRNVFDIPVEQTTFEGSSPLVKGKLQEGPCLISGNSFRAIVNLLQNVGPLNEKIILGNDLNIVNIGTYIHEITHSLLNRHQGVVQNFFNDEILPIFMEQVALDLCDPSPDKKNLRTAQLMRFKDIQISLRDMFSPFASREAKYESLKYIQSGILEGLLFEKYEKSDEADRSAILSEVGDILNGKQPVQSIIDSEQLSLDDSQHYFDYIQERINSLNPTMPNIDEER